MTNSLELLMEDNKALHDFGVQCGVATLKLYRRRELMGTLAGIGICVIAGLGLNAIGTLTKRFEKEETEIEVVELSED